MASSNGSNGTNGTGIRPELRKQIASARAIRELATDGFLFELPSGFIVRMVAADIAVLYRSGRIPDQLTPLLVELVATDRIDPSSMVSKATESMEAMTQLIDLVCCAALKEPRCVMLDNQVLPEDAIHPEHLSLEDRQAIFSAANAPSEALRLFRLKQSEPVESVADGKGVRDEAKSPAAD